MTAADAARVANAPDYRAVVDGQTITPRLRGRLTCLRLTDQRGGEADQLDLTLSDHDGRLELPPRGAEIQLAIGWRHSGLIDRGTFTVDELEHSGAADTLAIRARSVDMRQGLPNKRTRSWHETTVGDIVRTIAARHGLIARAGDRLAGRAIKHIDQTDESDIHFLSRLAERFDAVATVKAGNLLFIPAGEGSSASGTAIPAVTLTRRHGDRHRYVVTDRDTYSGVTAQWRDIEGNEKRTVVAGSEDNAKALRPTYASEADALDAARAEWTRIRRSEGELSLTLAEGRADLYPETPVNVRGFKPDIDGTPWLIKEITHNLDDSSYTCQIALEHRNADSEGDDEAASG